MDSGYRWKSDFRDLWVLCLLTLVVMFVFRGILSGTHEPFISSMRDFEPWASNLPDDSRALDETVFNDPTTQTYPWSVYAHEQLRDGDFPLWNMGMFSGTPFMANRLTGMFDPTILLPVWLMEPIPALGFFYLLHYLMAGWFLYLFLKSLGISRPAAIFGSLAFILQGSYIPWMGFIVADKAYFPMSLYFLNGILDRNDWRGYFGFIVSFFLLSVSSYPLMVVFAIYIFAAWVLFSREGNFPARLKSLAGLAILMAAIFLLGSMQHLPMLEFYRMSLRAQPEFMQELGGLTKLERNASPVFLLCIWFPTIFGDYLKHPVTSVPEFVLAIYNYAYIGILSGFCFLFAPAVWKNRQAKFFIVSSLIGLIFLGWHQVYVLAAKILPGLRISTVKPDFLTLTFMIITGSYVLDHILKSIKSHPDFYVKFERVYSWLIGVMLGLVLVLLASIISPGLNSPANFGRTFSIFISLGLAFIAASTLILHVKKGLNLKWAVIVIIAVQLLDLLPYKSHFNPLVPKGRLCFKTPAIEFLESKMAGEGPFRIFRDRRSILPPNTPMIYGLDEPGGFDSFVSADYANYFRNIDPGMSRNSRTLDLPADHLNYREPFWDFLNVRYIVSPGPMPYLPEDWIQVSDQDMVIYENTSCLPRLFLVPEILPVSDAEDGYDASRGISPRQMAVVEGIDHADIPPSLLSGDSIVTSSESDNFYRIDLAHYSADEVLIDVNSDRDSYLVFSDTFYPGWRAWIDNSEVRIYRTNGIIKGVVMPEGEHTVRFLYDPQTYRFGWILSIVGLTLILVIRKPVGRLFHNYN